MHGQIAAHDESDETDTALPRARRGRIRSRRAPYLIILASGLQEPAWIVWPKTERFARAPAGGLRFSC